MASPSGPLVAGIHSFIVAGGFLIFGYLLSRSLLGRWLPDPTAHWGLAIPSLCAYASLIMVVHVATRGLLLNHRPAVVLIVVLTLGVLILRVRSSPAPRLTPLDRLIMVGLVVLGLAVWGSPVLRLLPLYFGGDIDIHMGWTEQLLNGEPTPSAPLTGNIPNFYPWLFHGITAVVTIFTPGGRAFHSLGPLHLLTVMGSILALYALGREVGKKRTTGAGAALFGALSGGMGFFLVDGYDLVLNRGRESDPGAQMRYLGDLVFERPSNLAFHNLAPVFPREIAFIVLEGLLLLLIVGLSRKRRELVYAGGVALGIIGLIGGETLIAGAVVSLAAVTVAGTSGRFISAVRLLIPAGLVYSLWLIPMVVNYRQYGGFADLGFGELQVTPLGLLVAAGIVVPFAIIGAAVLIRRMTQDPRARVVLATFLAMVGVIVVSTIASMLLGEGFETLSRRHRYWPLLHLSIALAGGIGLDIILRSVHRWSRVAAAFLIVTVSTAALASPIIASVALPSRLERQPLLSSALVGDPEAVLNVFTRSGHRRCIGAVPPPLSRRAFSYSGYRLVLYSASYAALDRPNVARIRWRDIYASIPRQRERATDNRILTQAAVGDPAWTNAAERNKVDVVVRTPRGSVETTPFGISTPEAEWHDTIVTVIDRGTCDP